MAPWTFRPKRVRGAAVRRRVATASAPSERRYLPPLSFFRIALPVRFRARLYINSTIALML